MLDQLYERDGQTLTELERALPAMTRFGVMKHLRILEAAGLVVSRKVGRKRHHYLNPVPIQEIHGRWLDKYRARSAATLIDLRSTLERPSVQTDSTVATSTETPAGTSASGADSPPAQVFTIFVRTTPEALWQAITDPEFTPRYYYATRVESDWQPSSPFNYRIEGRLAIQGEVLEVVPPRRLVTTFDAQWDESVAPDAPSRISWEIDDAAPGERSGAAASGPERSGGKASPQSAAQRANRTGVCKLTVIHDGIARPTPTYEQVAGGMPFILSSLKTLLETGSGLTGTPKRG
jgi:uncharacterized protein YndB with AHSA1/START domain